MNVKSEKLFNGITGIRDDIVEEAAAHKFKKAKFTWRRVCAVAAALALTVGLGAVGLRLMGASPSDAGGSASGGGGGSGESYMSYAGPVFPLTVLGPSDGLTAERNVNFDFSPYETTLDEDGYESYDAAALVTDSYTLKNTTAEDISVTALYPFAGSFSKAVGCMPEISSGGETSSAKLYAGPYCGVYTGAGTDGEDGGDLNLSQPCSWEDYRSLLSDGGYMASAMDENPELSQPVVVYELSGRTAPEDSGAENPTLNMEFSIDYAKTTILSYNMNGGTNDPDTGFCARQTHVPGSTEADYGRSAYLIVLGDDLEGYELKGYSNGSCEADAALEGVTATVTRYETTLAEILDTVIGQAMETNAFGSAYGQILGSVSKEMFFGSAAELLESRGLLSDDPAERYDFGTLEDIISETFVMQRVMYMCFSLVVPAFGSVEVSASMTKEASFDFIGEDTERNGFDLVTGLGSTLSFSSQTASVSNTDCVEISGQNIGFDPNSGVTKVKLDPDCQHYWLEVRRQRSSR